MATRCKSCLGAGIKRAIAEQHPELEAILATISDCASPDDMKICGTGGKRQPSEYNLFIKQCLATKPIKGKPFGTAGEYMKECAAEYKRQRK